MDGLEAICFTGGEPFLELDTMSRLIRVSESSGLKSAAVTNGVWARDEERAFRILAQLSDWGLRNITLSTDTYHQPFVNARRIANALKAAAKIDGLSATLNWVLRPGETPDDAKASFPAFELADVVSFFPVLGVGRQPTERATGPSEPDSLTAAEWPQARCRLVISTLSVKSSGDLFACCGVGGFTKSLLLGSLRTSSFSDLLREATTNPLIRALAIHGPRYLALSSPDVARELSDLNFKDECDLCHALLKNDARAAKVSESVHDRSITLDLEYDFLAASEEGNAE